MSVVDSLLGASGAKVVGRLAQDLGLDDDRVRDAITSLMPALVAGVKENTSQPGGLQELLTALQLGRHQRYVDDPSLLSAPETTRDGNAILDHVLGSRERSRAVAAAAASRTGLGVDVMMRLLPLMACLVMAHLSRAVAPAPPPEAQPASSASTFDTLGSLLRNV